MTQVSYMEGSNLARVPLQSEFSMLRSKNWALRFLLHVEKTKIVLGADGKFLIDPLRPTFHNFIITFPELAFHEF
jgi:hypothetical protein